MITVENLTKTYGTRRAVDNLSFEVQPGRVTGFVGPNGSGKSTTMRMMVGLTRPDDGHVHYNGTAYHQLDRPVATIGATLDAVAHPGRTARNHLRTMCAASGLARSRAEEVLHEVGIDSVADQRVGGFSLGMRQRLALAGALLGEPETLLLDEPANGLDPDGGHDLCRLRHRRPDHCPHRSLSPRLHQAWLPERQIASTRVPEERNEP